MRALRWCFLNSTTQLSHYGYITPPSLANSLLWMRSKCQERGSIQLQTATWSSTGSWLMAFGSSDGKWICGRNLIFFRLLQRLLKALHFVQRPQGTSSRSLPNGQGNTRWVVILKIVTYFDNEMCSWLPALSWGYQGWCWMGWEHISAIPWTGTAPKPTPASVKHSCIGFGFGSWNRSYLYHIYWNRMFNTLRHSWPRLS